MQVYYISKATLKVANKQYNTLSHDYEITLHAHSSIVPCADGHGIPAMQCDFVPIAELENRDKDVIIGKQNKISITWKKRLAAKIAATDGIIYFEMQSSISQTLLIFSLFMAAKDWLGLGSSRQNMVVVIILHHLGYHLDHHSRARLLYDTDAHGMNTPNW